MDDSSNKTTKNEKITIEINESTRGKTHAMAISAELRQKLYNQDGNCLELIGWKI